MHRAVQQPVDRQVRLLVWIAAAMPTGEMSSGPCTALLIWYWAAKSNSLRSGVVVWERTSRSPSWFSAGVQSSSQNRSYGSKPAPAWPPGSG
ncbi:hypothetical protein [Nonomuraea maheshkhaliensis]|uniref:hypothetical protein n=1 Tax=Nonomuraea maheshkhaliensis TaxID=419590 RepID=UPI0031F7D7A9